jgi:hypothetical protein
VLFGALNINDLFCFEFIILLFSATPEVLLKMEQQLIMLHELSTCLSIPCFLLIKKKKNSIPCFSSEVLSVA